MFVPDAAVAVGPAVFVAGAADDASPLGAAVSVAVGLAGTFVGLLAGVVFISGVLAVAGGSAVPAPAVELGPAGVAVAGPAVLAPAVVRGTAGPSVLGPAVAGLAVVVGPAVAGTTFVVPAAVVPAVVGPVVVGPAAVGPTVVGSAVVGPAVAGPAVAGPAVADPAVVGSAVVGPAVAGTPFVVPTVGAAILSVFAGTGEDTPVVGFGDAVVGGTVVGRCAAVDDGAAPAAVVVIAGVDACGVLVLPLSAPTEATAIKLHKKEMEATQPQSTCNVFNINHKVMCSKHFLLTNRPLIQASQVNEKTGYTDTTWRSLYTTGLRRPPSKTATENIKVLLRKKTKPVL